MMPTKLDELASVPPPAYHQAQAWQAGLHFDALTLVTMLHLRALYRVTMRLAHWHCPPVHESLFALTVLVAIRRRLNGAHDLIIDSAPYWRGGMPIPMLRPAMTQAATS